MRSKLKENDKNLILSFIIIFLGVYLFMYDYLVYKEKCLFDIFNLYHKHLLYNVDMNRSTIVVNPAWTMFILFGLTVFLISLLNENEKQQIRNEVIKCKTHLKKLLRFIR